uniref:Uncharacterized protein n=2 Tax=Micrurus surinamensis TaxID=129470 RepID=A0A2D4P4Y5_MICSU
MYGGRDEEEGPNFNKWCVLWDVNIWFSLCEQSNPRSVFPNLDNVKVCGLQLPEYSSQQAGLQTSTLPFFKRYQQDGMNSRHIPWTRSKYHLFYPLQLAMTEGEIFLLLILRKYLCCPKIIPLWRFKAVRNSRIKAVQPSVTIIKTQNKIINTAGNTT